MNLDRIIAVRNNKTIYRDFDKCIKTFSSNYSKADVLNEALKLSRIENIGIKTPKLIEVTQINGKWAIVTEFVQGKTLERLMQEDPGNKPSYMGIFVDLQLELHRNIAEALPSLKDNMNRKIIQSDLDATYRFDLFRKLEKLPGHHNLCHGDFTPANIIISDDDIPYILDWSHATQGDPAGDAACTYLKFWLNGNIDDAEKYLDKFAYRSGISKEHIKIWLPLVAAAHSLSCTEQQREFILSWIKDGYNN